LTLAKVDATTYCRYGAIEGFARKYVFSSVFCLGFLFGFLCRALRSARPRGTQPNKLSPNLVFYTVSYPAPLREFDGPPGT